jgi:hypothetical protein
MMHLVLLIFGKIAPIYFFPKDKDGVVRFVDLWPKDDFSALGVFRLPCSGEDLCNKPETFLGGKQREVVSGVLGFDKSTEKVCRLQ